MSTPIQQNTTALEELLDTAAELPNSRNGVHIGPEAPTGDETVWIDTDEEAPAGNGGGTEPTAGKDGFSPIATVEQTADGAVVSITDKNGTTTATISNGEDGQRGTGLLPVTTAPSSYTTAVNGLTPAYRIALSKVKSEASVSEVFAGDTLRYSYYHYPVIYVDSSYVYCRTRVSIRGATGGTGAAGANGKSAYQYAQDGGYTGTEEEFAAKLAQETAASGIHIGTDAPADEKVNVWIDTDEEPEQPSVNPGGGTVVVQSDWNAAEGEPGHILNRTHSAEIFEKELLPEQEYSFAEGVALLANAIPFEVGKTYKVYFDGVLYSCVAYYSMFMENTTITIGNGNIYGFPEGNNEPFAIAYIAASGMTGAMCTDTSTHTIKIAEDIEEVQTIPKKYIADSIPFYVNINSKIRATPNEIKSALENGRVVIGVNSDNYYNLYKFTPQAVHFVTIGIEKGIEIISGVSFDADAEYDTTITHYELTQRTS